MGDPTFWENEFVRIHVPREFGWFEDASALEAGVFEARVLFAWTIADIVLYPRRIPFKSIASAGCMVCAP